MKSLSRICIPVLLILAATATTGCNREKGEATDSRKWAEATFAHMTETQKMGQVLFLTVDPLRYYLDSAYKAYVQGLVKLCSPGGIYFSSQLESYNERTFTEFDAVKINGIVREIMSFAVFPPLAAADFESGAWHWDRNATRFPCPLAMGAINSSTAAYRQGKIIASEAKAQGISMVFAPVITPYSPGASILENMNRFGSDPARVADFSSRFVQGLQEAGVAACLKYFDAGESASEEPVQSGISAGVSAIMGNLFTPAEIATPGNEKSALTTRYGFQGIVIRSVTGPDSTSGFPRIVNGLLESFKEGQDMVILPDDMERNRAFADYLLTQVRIKNLDTSMLDASVKKILLLKEKIGIQNPPKNDLLILSGMGVREYHQTAESLTRSSVTVLKNEGNIIPLKTTGQHIMFVNLIDRNSSADGIYFSETTLKEYPGTKVMSVLPDPDPRIVQEVLRRAGEADAVICTLFLKPAPEDPSPKIPADHLALLRRIAGINRQTACVSFYSPAYIADIPGVKAFLTTYSLSPVSMRAAVEILFGKAGASGKLPFSVSASYPEGFGIILPGPGAQTASSAGTGSAAE
jgi:beta-N-acetylhexosaminidase